MFTKLDKLIVEFDTGLRTLLAQPRSMRPHPDASTAEADLTEAEKTQACALMRVNHTGEVCAQALYSGQSLTAHSERTAAALKLAAQEETDHLAWCESRIKQLGGRTSLLNPVFYAGSFGLGLVAGTLGNRWNLGFVAETEKQVGAHLASHLEILATADQKTRKIVEQMQVDEAAHANQARAYGAAELPSPINFLMHKVAKVMTTVSYHL